MKDIPFLMMEIARLRDQVKALEKERDALYTQLDNDQIETVNRLMGRA
jgi:hypothetical protein